MYVCVCVCVCVKCGVKCVGKFLRICLMVENRKYKKNHDEDHG